MQEASDPTLRAVLMPIGLSKPSRPGRYNSSHRVCFVHRTVKAHPTTPMLCQLLLQSGPLGPCTRCNLRSVPLDQGVDQGSWPAPLPKGSQIRLSHRSVSCMPQPQPAPFCLNQPLEPSSWWPSIALGAGPPHYQHIIQPKRSDQHSSANLPNTTPPTLPPLPPFPAHPNNT